MRYVPPLKSCRRLAEFRVGDYYARLLGDIVTTGVIQYEFLLVLFTAGKKEPILIVSSEHLARGPRTVLGVFTERGHKTLYDEGTGWDDVRTFTNRAFQIVTECFGVNLEEGRIAPDEKAAEPGATDNPDDAQRN